MAAARPWNVCNSLRRQFISRYGTREWLCGCRNRCQRQGEHSNVVLLTELDGRVGDLLGGARAELARAIKAEELAHGIARSSGYADLDNEVMAMIMRAEPLPPFPETMPQTRIDLTVPIRFSLR